MANKVKEHLESAISKLNSACDDLIVCDTAFQYDDFKYYVSRIKEMLSCDNGEAGLHALNDTL